MSASSPLATTTATPYPPPPFQRMDTLPKTQRGLNKPKCIHAAMLPVPAFPEKSPTSSTPPSEQKSTQASSQVTPLRVPSFRQLSNAFAQFDNLQALNWYAISGCYILERMENISLLEEVFSIKSMDEGSDEDEGSKPSPTSKEDQTSGLKLTLKSDPVRTNNARKRIKQIVDQGIEKLKRTKANDGAHDPDDQNKLDGKLNKVKNLWVERASVVSDIVDKLNKARNEEDLKSCMEMKAQLYNQSSMSSETEMKDPATFNKECTETPRQVTHHLLTRIEIDQETFNKINAHFSTVEQIEDL
ncbi:Disease resistance family protein / LRR family protein [Hibiscus syriacus]|uniref:Disease resistance family protein / LRR family protein n=1 Tax=Hibiscus syriacus TaxID=106335 RepID=A0A6A3BP39_HIBSY|nr:Disease resistance family protein / LRR family protein [Hibiscus syriacus]